MLRFREIKEVKNEMTDEDKRRLAELDRPLYEDSERDDESLIRILGEYEFNRRRLEELDRRLEELDNPIF